MIGHRAVLALLKRDAANLSISLGDRLIHGAVRRDGDTFHVFTGGRQHPLAYKDPIIEAMKMKHTIAAPGEGLVEELLYQVGGQVADGAQLLSLKPH